MTSTPPRATAPASSTGIAFLDKRLDAWSRIPPGSLARRFGYAGLLIVGLLMSAYASYLFTLIPPISIKFFPDARLLALLVSGAFISLQAMGGSARRRALALYGAIGWVIVFHLEEATIHWIGPVPGSITGTRVGPIGTAGSLLMLASVVLMHIEVERVRLRNDVTDRGATQRGADEMSEALAGEGRRQVWGMTFAVAAVGLLVFAAEKVIGDSASGGGYTLIVGGGGLLLMALYLMRLVPGASARVEPSRAASSSEAQRLRDSEP